MILKILLTLGIVIAVLIWFRAQKTKQAHAMAKAQGRLINEKADKNSWVKPLLFSLTGLTIAVGVLLYYLSWQEDHTHYQITITNPQTGSTETYIALKKDMFGRMFITEGGLQVNASDLERIEIKKIEAGID